ncbi:MAG: sodium-dependent bicarbonate transport family permease [Betaproteobacteria bacterium]
MTAFASLLTPAVMFFALGAGAQACRSDLKFPPDLVKALSIYLLIGIGLHGGEELANASLGTAIQAVLAALVLGAVLPLVAYGILVKIGRLGKLDAAAIAAHYGSVSAGTFLAASAFLQAKGVVYEGYPVIMLAVMETPAIIIGLVLAQAIRASDKGAVPENGGMLKMLIGAARHGSIVLLLGSMLIGATAAPKALAAVMPFYQTIFLGALCLYLLELGMVAAQRLGEFRQLGWFLTLFGIAMPLIGAICGLAVGHYWLGLSAGGVTLVAVLGASASYIAVPPAVRMAIPEANPSLYLTLSLGITFPFNVMVGIPLYYSIAEWLLA